MDDTKAVEFKVTNAWMGITDKYWAATLLPSPKANVQARIHALNTQTKEGLAAMPHVTLHTPADSALSSGLVCFDVAGMKPQQVVERLHAKGIIMSATPYRQSHARFAPSLLNDEAEIDRALAQIRALA